MLAGFKVERAARIYKGCRISNMHPDSLTFQAQSVIRILVALIIDGKRLQVC